MAKYLIYEACGSGAISASVVKSRLAERLKKAGIKDYELRICRTGEVESICKGQHPDLMLISAGSYSYPDTGGVPILSGVPFMSGIGVDALMEKILEILKAKG